jgi:hypothetical protein
MPQTDLPAALLTCSAELSTLQSQVARIETALGYVIEDPATALPVLIRDLQELDQMRQTLEDLGRFLAQLATGSEDIEVHRAAQELRLERLRQILGPPDRAPPPAEGVDMF